MKGKNTKIRKEVEEKLGAEELEKHVKKLSIKDQKMSEEEKKIGLKGDKRQGESLLKKKKSLKNQK